MHAIWSHFHENGHNITLKSVITALLWDIFSNFAAKFDLI